MTTKHAISYEMHVGLYIFRLNRQMVSNASWVASANDCLFDLVIRWRNRPAIQIDKALKFPLCLRGHTMIQEVLLN